MLKNSKQNNEKVQKNQRKKVLKMYSSNSITILQNSSKKIKNKHNQKKSLEKKTIKKQSSYISNETIKNEHKKKLEKKIGRHLSMRSSDIKRKKIIENKIDIEIYLKEIKSNKKKVKTKSKKINTNNNFSTEINSKNILNKNLNLFSPIEKIKNKKIYNIYDISVKSNSKSKSKKNIFLPTNNNKNKNNSNSIKSNQKRTLCKNESNINLNIPKDKLNMKPFCTMLNIPNNNKIKEVNNNHISKNENNLDFNYLSEENNLKEKNKNNKKKIKSIKIINNATNKYEEFSQEDLIFYNIYKQKHKLKKKLSYNEPNYINSTSSYKNKTKNKINKSNKSINKKNNINNNNNNQTRNNQLNKIYNTNFNINTQTAQEKKSLTIITNNNDNKHKYKIKSERNKNVNIEFKTQNSNINKNNYLNIVSLFDKLKKYKNGKKIKKNNLELCLLNDTNNIKINSTNTNTNNNTNYFLDENQIKENLVNNALTMYSIYILSKYYQNCDKIALTKIILFDKNKEQIPIIYYNTNNKLNTKQKIGIFSLFNYTKINKENISNNFSLYECNNKDIPLILEFKKNLCINFFIKSINAENIDFIQINNYCDIKNNISSIKYIEIFKGNQIIYNGNLHEINIINKIYINNNNNKKAINNKIYNSVINTNKNLKIMNDIKQQRPLSSSKPKSNIETQNTKTSTYRKSEVDEYYKKRNVFKKSFKKNFILIDNKENNNKYKLDYYKKQNDFLYKCLNKKYNMNDIRNTKLVTGNLKQEINISNTYTLNNMTNNMYDIQKTYCDFGELFTNNTNSEISNNINNINHKLNSQKIFYISSLNNNINTTDESNMISKIKDKNIINAYDTNIKKENDEKIIIRSNSEKKYKNHLIKTQKSILFQKILEENNKDINYNTNNYYSNNISIYENINKYSTYKNYIEFNKIRFVLTSNYGHKKFIGLTGIEFYDIKDKLINIETASSVGALPKDLKTIYNDNDEVRIFENVFNNYNNTNDIDNMWVTKFNKTTPYTFIEIYFEQKIKISKIKIFNYNQKEKLDIGVKTLEIYLDDKFYSKINLRQGLGDYAYDYLDNYPDNKNNNNNNNSFIYDNKILYDFGQIIQFPIIKEEKNLLKDGIYDFDKINFASLLYEQSYETPYLPCGDIIKFQFMSNYYKGISLKDKVDILKYNDIGINKIEIFDKEGKNIEFNYNNNNYKIISNCEMLHNNENKIILNGIHNENNNNCIYYIFDKLIQISYIKFYPLTNDKKIKSLNTLQEIKIFLNNNIIFEGNLYLYYPTIILFTCDSNIIKNINEKYLTKNIKFREYKEISKENYISLVFH